MTIEILPFPKNKPLPKWLIWMHYHIFKFGFTISFEITWCMVIIKLYVLWLDFDFQRLSDGAYWWRLKFFNSNKLKWGNLP